MHLAMHFRPATLIGVVLLLVLRLVFRVGLKVVLRMLRPVLAARKENKKNINNTNTDVMSKTKPKESIAERQKQK